MKKLFRIQLILLFLSTLFACEKEMDKYYERPDWLRGSAYEVMKDRGNFNLFLSAIDRAGYKTAVNGRELCTVMAPTDEAFQKYLKRHNYASVEDIPVDTLKLLVPYHMIQKAFDPEMFLEFEMSPTGGYLKGASHKYKTYAQPDPFDMVDPMTGRKVKTYNDNLYLPVVSTKLFETKKCTNYKDNYSFFWPDINWLGDENQLHVQGAAVIEQGIFTDNGFLYVLDDVCEPLRTVYQALEKPSSRRSFDQFLKIYNRFAEVGFKSISAVTGDSLYNFNHYRMRTSAVKINFPDQIPSIASTIAYHNDYNTRDDYFMYQTYTYNCFAPTDQALEEYFSERFSAFESWDDIPQLTLYYFLMPYAREGKEIMLPEPIVTSGVRGEMGETWEVTSEDIVAKEFCSNGIVYGLDKVFDPWVFNNVTKPLFMTPDYSIVANLFFKAEAIPTLTDQTADKYTLFVVPDSILESDVYNMSMNYAGTWFNEPDESVQILGDNASATTAKSIADMSIVLSSIKDFSKRAYYSTRTGDTYLYTNNGMLYDQDGLELKILQTWEVPNGVTYAVDHLLYRNATEISYIRPATMTKLKNDYKEFYDLLKKAGLIKANDKYEYIDGLGYVKAKEEKMNQSIIFVPDNLSAWANLSNEDLAKKLQYCIIPMGTNYISNYLLPEVGLDGAYMTIAKSAQSSGTHTVYEKLSVSFDDYRVVLRNATGTSNATTSEYLPHFTQDGMIIKIDNTIQAN